MHFSGPHECPHCTRYCNVEDYAERQSGDRLVAYLDCDSCSKGVERLYKGVDGNWVFCWDKFHSLEKPREYARFLRRLEDARTQRPTLAVAAVA